MKLMSILARNKARKRAREGLSNKPIISQASVTERGEGREVLKA
jgi:hypothetical protein